MKIKFLSGPKQGQESHIRNDAGTALVEMGMAEEIKPKTMDEFFRQHAVAGPNNTALQFVPEPGVWSVCEGINGKWFQWKHLTATERTDSIDVARKNGCPEDVIAKFQRGN